MSRCMTSGMMSSSSDDWETPLDLWEKLDEEFDFDLDVCASSENAKCATYFDIEADGLKQPWTGTVWMNPPYKGIRAWMDRAMQYGGGGNCGLPRASTDGHKVVVGVLYESE